MVDFPDAPNAGDQWTEEGTTWVYRDPPGAWVVVTGDAGDPVTIVEDDSAAGWCVVGTTLFQWGSFNATGVALGITLPQPYRDTSYSIMGEVLFAEAGGDPRYLLDIGVRVQGTTSFNVWPKYFDDTSGNIAVDTGNKFYWMTVGPAPDDLIQPKTVQTVGGSELQEYHDPDGSGWRIVGSTLECWGYVANNGTTTSRGATFPKVFASTPALMLSCTWGNRIISEESILTTSFVARAIGSDGQSNPGDFAFRWHAIGEWDGT